MNWKDVVQKDREMVLATSSKDGKPHAIFVMCEGWIDDKILINACQTTRSLNNLTENPLACLVIKHEGNYYRIKGKVELHSSGKYFDIGVERNADGNNSTKSVILVSVEEVFDLDKIEKIL
ncbi:MAG: pyridoxamine 5'-phosphate oxidase family protein [Candidatus Aenigmarchaeota archaeon]|nr:pyridoxamine 5'-phosphate oxidase family protein [Candidatus Aenigmarchaeota archaeon]